MDLKFLEFEQPIAELEAKIEELRFVGDDSEININEEVSRLKGKSKTLTRNIFSKGGICNAVQIREMSPVFEEGSERLPAGVTQPFVLPH